MGREGKTGMKQRSSRPSRKRIMDSEDSDEDYVAEVDEVDEQSDDSNSLVGDALEEESCFEKEEEEEADYDEDDGREGGWRTVVKPRSRPKPEPRAQKGLSGPRKNGVNRPKKRRKVTRDSDDDSDDDDDDDDDDEEFTPSEYSESVKSIDNDEDEEFAPDEGPESVSSRSTPTFQKGFSRSRRNGGNMPNKRRKVTCDDDDDDSDDDDGDEEFTPDEFEEEEEEDDDDDDDDVEDEVEEEEEEKFMKAKTNSIKRRANLKRKKPVKSRRKRRAKTLRKPSRQRSKRTSSSRKKANSDGDEEFVENGQNLRGRTRRKPGRRKKTVIDGSDSDAYSGSSDREFTISEEEMEQIREANLFCGTTITDLRSSRKVQEEQPFCQPKKPLVKKGKEKAGETKNDVGKPVCGICLTEEGKSTVRGTLNCCSHYFCFACIMEWSKVETRCPLCKQRFVTISKPTKCGKGFDLRNVMVTVPERDQVYQPSEEELRNFLNPYENVICTECNHGGDDALMLLCDICDSPAHTYCVGLGREVPEGNWYCDGCRPAALASLLSQSQDYMPDQRSGSHPGLSDGRSTYENMAEIDLNVTIPETPLSQGDRLHYSPRYSGGNLQVPSPVSGIGVSTVSDRRRMHRIRHILSNRSSQTGGENSSQGNMIGFRDNATFHPGRSGVGTSYQAQQAGRFQENHIHRVQNMDFALRRPGNVMGHVGRPSALANRLAIDQRVRSGLDSVNLEPTQGLLSASGPLVPCTSRSNNGPYSSGFSSENREEDRSNFVKDEVHSIVTNQLKSISRDMNLGQANYMDIVRRSTNSIMAAYGLEPRGPGTYDLPPPVCVHLRDRLANVVISPVNGCCLACFLDFVKVVVQRIIDITTMTPHWQDLRH